MSGTFDSPHSGVIWQLRWVRAWRARAGGGGAGGGRHSIRLSPSRTDRRCSRRAARARQYTSRSTQPAPCSLPATALPPAPPRALDTHAMKATTAVHPVPDRSRRGCQTAGLDQPPLVGERRVGSATAQGTSVVVVIHSNITHSCTTPPRAGDPRPPTPLCTRAHPPVVPPADSTAVAPDRLALSTRRSPSSSSAFSCSRRWHPCRNCSTPPAPCRRPSSRCRSPAPAQEAKAATSLIFESASVTCPFRCSLG